MASTATAPDVSGSRASTGQGTNRLQFLDALRGIAAFAVVVEHTSEQLWPGFAEFTLTHFRLGEFGVVVFFLCSGFIIPASLERRGSLRHFWIGRFFRLFPLYWTVLGLVVLLHFLDVYRGLSPIYEPHWLRYSVVNATMLQDWILDQSGGQQGKLALGLSWTLAYEMAFYLIVSVLFVAKLHKRSVPLAVVGFVVSAIVGFRLSSNALYHLAPTTAACLIAALIATAVGTWWITRGQPVPMQVGSIVVMCLVITLIFNRFEPTWQAAFFLGTMFAGTAIYRWTEGQISTRSLSLLGMLGLIAIIVAQQQNWSPWLAHDPETNWKFHLAEVTTYIGAYVLFWAGILFRDIQFPRFLIYLGTISYSMYLVHPLILYTVPVIEDHKTMTVLIWNAGTIAASSITYYIIEKPSIAYGRRVARRLVPRR